MRVTVIVPILLFSLAGMLPAAATGTLDCVADDATANIAVHGVVPYGMGAPLLQVHGEIAAELPGIATDLSTTVFDAEHQVQYWLDDEVLNLLFYKERLGDGPFGATTLEIKTRRDEGDEEGVYSGGYDIEGYEVRTEGGESVTIHARGTIECFAG